MKYSDKHRKILALMILSQVLLTVFMLQWVRSQYKDEKERLTQELNILYMDARDQMVDTILFRSFVSPALTPEEDTIYIKEDRFKGIVRWEGNDGRVTVSVKHGPDSAKLFPDTIRLRKNKNELLLRSVKLIISHTRDTLRRDEPLIRDFGIAPDTAAFKMHFHRSLEDAGLKFNLLWINDSAGSIAHGKTLYVAPHNPFSLPAISVKNYNGYLTGKILPQILFGVFLILLTALAFMLSYRSLRDHAIYNNLRNEFISNMTHELKTPVASISLALESLSKYNLRDDPKVMDEYLNLALSETRRLEDLVNRVLDHSALEESIQSLNFSETELNLLIGEVISVMQVKLQDKGSIMFSPPGKKLMIKCDPLLLKGVILNLLDNSIKYTEDRPEIVIETGEEERNAIITVSDNGPGIPEEYHDKIFEKFFRVPSGNIHNVKGYGLGLSFASLVMKLHSGKISLRNLDKGCSFILKIPLAHAED